MAKRIRTNNDLQNIHIKLKIELNMNPTKNWVWTRVLQKGKQFLFHYQHAVSSIFEGTLDSLKQTEVGRWMLGI
jgi:hypothetical protein